MQADIYKPIRSYDAPGVMAAQLLEGEASWRSFRDTLLNPSALGLAERTDLGDSLARGMATSGDPLSSAIIGVATNPLVYLMAVQPAGYKAIAAGKSIFGTGKRVSAGSRKGFGLLGSWILNPLQQFRGTDAPDVLTTVARVKEAQETDILRMMQGESGPVAALLRELKRRDSGVKSLRLQDHKPGSQARELLEEVHAALFARGHNLDILDDAGNIPEGILPPKVPQLVQKHEVLQDDGTWKNLLDTREGASIRRMMAKDPNQTDRLLAQAVENRTTQIQVERDKFSTEWISNVWRNMTPKQRAQSGGMEAAMNRAFREHLKKKQLPEFRTIITDVKEVDGALQGLYKKSATQAVFDSYGGLLDDFYDAHQYVALRKHMQLVGDEEHFWKVVAEKVPGVTREMADQLTPSQMRSVLSTTRGDYGAFKVDPNKSTKLLWAMRNKNFAGSKTDPSVLQGGRIVESLLGHDVARQLESGEMTGATFVDLVEKALVKPARQTGNYIPRIRMDVVPVKGRKYSPKDISAPREDALYYNVTDSVLPRTGNELLVHPDSLDMMDRVLGGSPASREMSSKLRRQAEQNSGTVTPRRREQFARQRHENRAVMAYTADFEDNFARFTSEANSTYALHVRDLTEAELISYRDTMGNYEELAALTSRNRKTGEVEAPGWSIVPGMSEQRMSYAAPLWEDGMASTRARVSPAMLLQRTHDLLPAQVQKEMLRNVAIPAAAGKATEVSAAMTSANIWAKEVMYNFAESKVGKAIHEKGGEVGRKFIDHLRFLSDLDTPIAGGAGVTGGIAKYLYATHLGFNMASIMLNMTQPFLLTAATVGLRDIIPAYVDAFKEVSRYTSLRLKRYGLKDLNPAQREGLMRESFSYMGRKTNGENLLGLHPGVFSAVDAVSEFGQQGASGTMDKVLRWSMALFEKSEWMNRNVTAHALERATRRLAPDAATRAAPWTSSLFRNDLEQMVTGFQFAGDKLNQPAVFTKGLFANPLMRMFFTFPLRSATGQFYELPRLSGRDPRVGLPMTMARTLGVSALVYEIGKNTIGADLSRGLGVAAATDVVGGDRLLAGDGNYTPFPVPPVIDIPVGMIAGLAKGDAALMSDSIARLVPGGVALNRLLGAAPRVPREGPLGVLGALQKQYVDWSNPEADGTYRVFNGEGSLVTRASGAELAARALGLDFNAWQQIGGLDSYLVKQREAMSEMQRAYIDARLHGEHGRADRIARSFGERFKHPETGEPLPLTISQAQLRAARERRGVNRGERILNRLPAQVRPQYGQVLAGSGRSFGVAPESLAEGTTSSRRGGQVLLPGQEEEILRRLRRESTGEATTPSRAFESFSGRF